MGQQAPGTPTTQDIKDAVEILAFGVCSRSPAPLGLGNIGFDECPFFCRLSLWDRVLGVPMPQSYSMALTLL